MGDDRIIEACIDYALNLFGCKRGDLKVYGLKKFRNLNIICTKIELNKSNFLLLPENGTVEVFVKRSLWKLFDEKEFVRRYERLCFFRENINLLEGAKVVQSVKLVDN